MNLNQIIGLSRDSLIQLGRLWRWALKKTHKKNSMQSGLLPLKAKYKGGNIIITFRYEGNGLQMPDGERVSGFALHDMTDVPAALDARQLLSPRNTGLHMFMWTEAIFRFQLCNSGMLSASTFKIRPNERVFPDASGPVKKAPVFISSIRKVPGAIAFRH